MCSVGGWLVLKCRRVFLDACGWLNLCLCAWVCLFFNYLCLCSSDVHCAMWSSLQLCHECTPLGQRIQSNPSFHARSP